MTTLTDLLKRATVGTSRWGISHWCAVGVCLLGLTLIGGALVTRIRMQEDIEVMLPDDDPAFVAAYRLLKDAPFARSILIDLEASEANQVSLLTQTAERLSERLKGPYISKVIAGLPMEVGSGLLDWVYTHMPQLFTEADAEALTAMLDSGQVADTLRKDLASLNSLEGLWLRPWLGRDPLGFRNQAFRKLGAVAMVPGARIESGFLVDPTGRHVLVLAETPIPMGDARGGDLLLNYINEVMAGTVPSTIRTHVVCAHRYTVANARTIKNDLVKVFAISSLGLVAVFLLMLRTWRAIFVFAVPALATLAAVLVTSWFFGGISAIAVGFGGVLLGISDDLGLHVFFGLRGRGAEPSSHMADLAVPMTVSWATTVGVFVVLLGSGVPIQRQLAVFSLAGLVVALGLAVLWLPRWVASARQDHWRPALLSIGGKRGSWIIAVWLVLLAGGLPIACRVGFEGDLRAMGMTPKEVLADEYCVRDAWGDPRGRALVVVRAEDVDAALRTNEQVYARMAQVWGQSDLVSLAPLLPCHATQQANLTRWSRFWEGGRLERLREILDTEGHTLGFSKEAFKPFFQWVRQEREPFAIADLQEAAGPLMEPLLLQGGKGLGLINLVPDGDRTAQFLNAPGMVSLPGVESISQTWFASILRRSLERDFLRFLWGALAMVLLVLIVALRRVGKVVLCLLPAITGLVVMLAVMGLLGMKVNLFNMAAGVLVVGLSIDFGVFMVVERSQDADGTAERGVITGALTTLGGFGVLSLAHHPALFSLGVTVVLGLIPAMMCALLVLPALQKRQIGTMRYT